MADSEERQNNVQVVFPKNVPRPYAFECHRWIKEELKLLENEVLGVQIDTIVSCLFLKLASPDLCERLVKVNEGKRKFKYHNGTINEVKLSIAGIGLRNVKVFNLPFEIKLETIQQNLAPFGDVVTLTKEKWSTQHDYPVDNGIRTVQMRIKKHIPSFMVIGGHRAHITYDGQPKTCSFCHASDPLRQRCPRRRRPAQMAAQVQSSGRASFAAVAKGLSPARDAGNVENMQVDTVDNSQDVSTQSVPVVTSTSTIGSQVAPENVTSVLELEKDAADPPVLNMGALSSPGLVQSHEKMKTLISLHEPGTSTESVADTDAGSNTGFKPVHLDVTSYADIVKTTLSSVIDQAQTSLVTSVPATIVTPSFVVSTVKTAAEDKVLPSVVSDGTSATAKGDLRREQTTDILTLPPKPQRDSFSEASKKETRSRSGSRSSRTSVSSQEFPSGSRKQKRLQRKKQRYLKKLAEKTRQGSDPGRGNQRQDEDERRREEEKKKREMEVQRIQKILETRKIGRNN